MGMLPSHIALLAKEHQKHPIRGKVLTLGQQGVYLSLDEVEKLLESQNIPLSPLKAGVDVKSKVNKGQELWDRRTNAQTVLSLMGAQEVFASDCSQYENPDFLLDLNFPVGEEYFEMFDVILDIGTLEHVFNVPMLLQNINYMLKKGGDIIIMTPSSNTVDHGFYSISPTLYFDFFAVNNFNNFSGYLSESNPKMLFWGYPPKKSKIYQYSYVGPQFCLSSPQIIETIFFATKDHNSNSTEIKTPSQSLYLNAPNWVGNTQDNIKKVEREVKEKLLSKVKSVVRHLYHKIKYFLPAPLIMFFFNIYSFLLKYMDKSPNLDYIGQVNCSPNLKSRSCRTTINFKK